MLHLNIGWAIVSLLLVIAIMVLTKAFFTGSTIGKRPNGSGSDGFPSGHVALSVAIATIALLMGFSWPVVLILVLIAGVISSQRLFSHMHTELQVGAGAALGFLVPVGIAFATRSG